MKGLQWRVISELEAGDILNRGGPHWIHWILFHGDEFDRKDFEEWVEYYPTEQEAEQVSHALAGIDTDQALQVWCDHIT